MREYCVEMSVNMDGVACKGMRCVGGCLGKCPKM